MQDEIIIIGAGPAGYTCAIRCAELGLHPILIEQKDIGGVCLNSGCIPTKALLKNAQVVRLVQSEAKNYGIHFDNLQIDYATGVERARKVVGHLAKGLDNLFKLHHIEVIKAKATITAHDKISLQYPDGRQENHKARNIVIATGASFVIPDQYNFDQKRILSYQEALDLQSLPPSMTVVGSGAIGMEFATLFNSYGVEVSLIERENRLLPLEDADISREIERKFREKGMAIYTDAEVLDIFVKDEKATIAYRHGTSRHELNSDIILIAIGFKAKTKELISPSLPLELDNRGFIRVDDRMKTSIDGIWAIGDITGKAMLAHTGFTQGRICAEAIFGAPTQPIDYKMIPHATFCEPNIASFGYTETELKAKRITYKKGVSYFKHNGKASAVSQPDGWVKVLVGDRYGEILGVHAIGCEVSELIGQMSLAHDLEATVEELTATIHLHPSCSEAFLEALVQTGSEAR